MGKYWLFKSEPDVFSFADLAASPGKTAPWDGVRNFQARNFLRDEVKPGDQVLFYHSRIQPPCIVGIAEVVREAYPDPTAEAGSPWVCVDMKAVAALPRPVPLAAIKAEPKLAGIALVRMSRLSVMPISPEHWRIIAKMGGWAGK